MSAEVTDPATVTAPTCRVRAFLLVWVVPQVAQLFADTGTPLPLATRVLLGIVTVVRATWWVLLLLAVAAAVAGRRVLASPAGRGRPPPLALPPPPPRRPLGRPPRPRLPPTPPPPA